MFQQGVWAQPKGRDVGTVWQVRPHPNMPGQSMPRLSHCPVITTEHAGPEHCKQHSYKNTQMRS